MASRLKRNGRTPRRALFSLANADKVASVCRSLAIRKLVDALDLVHDLAREVVKLEHERDDLLGVVPMPDSFEFVDVITDDEAVAFITEVTNRWHPKGLNGRRI